MIHTTHRPSPATDSPISTRSQCVEGILRLIVAGDIPRATKTSEAEISKRLFRGQEPRSKTPVREALAVLAWQGFLHQVPQSGSFIHDVTLSEVEDLCDLRTEVECVVVRKLGGSSEIDIPNLDPFTSAVEGALNASDVDGFLVADTDLHARLATVAGYTSAVGTIRQWGDKLRVFASSPAIRRDVEAQNAFSERLGAICSHHPSLVHQLEARDADAACQTINSHFQAFAELAGEMTRQTQAAQI